LRPLHSAHNRRPNSPRLLVWTVPRRATSRIGTIGQRPVKTAPAPLRVLPRCKSSECGHLQTPYGRPFHSELGAHGWSRYGAPGSQPVATSGKSAGSRNRKNKRIPLPPPAASCVGKYMVSRASAVGCHPLRQVPSLRRRGSTPISARGWATSCGCSPGMDSARSRSPCTPRGSRERFYRRNAQSVAQSLRCQRETDRLRVRPGDRGRG
jgi:hypothetical protein